MGMYYCVFDVMVCCKRGRKGKKGQQRKKDSPTQSPTSPQKDGFKFDDNTKVNICTLHSKGNGLF